MGDHTALISIVTWFLLVTSAITTAARTAIKWHPSIKLGYDDLCAFMALLLQVGAGIALSIAADNGLGRPSDMLNSSQLLAMQQSIYAAGILFVLSITAARFTMVFLVWHLFISKPHRLAITVLGLFIAAQCISFAIAAAFSCHLPRTWAIGSDYCSDLAAFWLVVGIFDIVTDVALVVLPCLMTTTIQMTTGKKAIVAGCFGVRLLVAGASGIQLTHVQSFKAQETGPSDDLWTWFFVGQIVQTLEIIASCIPYWGQFLQAFPSGMLQFHSDGPRRPSAQSSATYTARSHSYVLRDVEAPYGRLASSQRRDAARRDSEEWLKHAARTSVDSVGDSINAAPADVPGSQARKDSAIDPFEIK